MIPRILYFCCNKCDKCVEHYEIEDVIRTGLVYSCSNCGYDSPANPEWLKQQISSVKKNE